MRRLLKRGAGLLALLMLFALPAQAQEYDTPEDDDTGELTEYATISAIVGEDESFETLATALEAAGLVGLLDGEGPYTVFAPTDEAFEALPEGQLEALLKKENRDELVQLLSYHVVEGRLMTDDILAMQLPQKIQTLQGMNISFAEDDLNLMVDSATILNPDVQAANGVIHVIDGVLTPTPGDSPQ